MDQHKRIIELVQEFFTEAFQNKRTLFLNLKATHYGHMIKDFLKWSIIQVTTEFEFSRLLIQPEEAEILQQHDQFLSNDFVNLTKEAAEKELPKYIVLSDDKIYKLDDLKSVCTIFEQVFISAAIEQIDKYFDSLQARPTTSHLNDNSGTTIKATQSDLNHQNSKESPALEMTECNEQDSEEESIDFDFGDDGWCVGDEEEEDDVEMEDSVEELPPTLPIVRRASVSKTTEETKEPEEAREETNTSRRSSISEQLLPYINFGKYLDNLNASRDSDDEEELVDDEEEEEESDSSIPSPKPVLQVVKPHNILPNSHKSEPTSSCSPHPTSASHFSSPDTPILDFSPIGVHFGSLTDDDYKFHFRSKIFIPDDHKIEQEPSVESMEGEENAQVVNGELENSNSSHELLECESEPEERKKSQDEFFDAQENLEEQMARIIHGMVPDDVVTNGDHNPQPMDEEEEQIVDDVVAPSVENGDDRDSGEEFSIEDSVDGGVEVSRQTEEVSSQSQEPIYCDGAPESSSSIELLLEDNGPQIIDPSENAEKEDEEEFSITVPNIGSVCRSDSENSSVTTQTRRRSSRRTKQTIVSSNEEDNGSEDDDEDSFVPTKKKRKRLNVIHSDDEVDFSSLENEEASDVYDFLNDVEVDGDEEEEEVEDEESEDTMTKKSRPKRRVRRLSSSSIKDEVKEEDNDDDDDEASDSKKPRKRNARKNIRALISDNDLEEETLNAQKAELEKHRRIQEKQKQYNTIKLPNPVVGDVKRVILDIEKEEVLVEIPSMFLGFLKPHQADGIKFLYDNLVETVKRLKKNKHGSGAVLAHSMGLGKTLQTIVFMYTVMTNVHIREHFKRVMVLCPSNVSKNWAQEFYKWLADSPEDINLYEMPTSPRDRLRTLKDWHENGGVLIVTLTLFSKLVLNKNVKNRKADLEEQFLSCLVDPGPDMVVIDEGHLLKNDKSQLNIAVSKFKTLRRVVLTGTPLQNNLSEYFVMVDFVRPRLLGSKKEFKNRFEHPILNGQHIDSSSTDVNLMKRRVHILNRLLKDIVHRCDYRVLVPYLPPKQEYVLKIKLTDLQVFLYQHYLQNFSSKDKATLFNDFRTFGYIWNHPHLLRNLEKEDQEDVSSFIDDSESVQSPISEERFIPAEEQFDSDDDCMFLGETIKPLVRKAGLLKVKTEEEDLSLNPKEWYKEHINEDLPIHEKIQLSTKFILLMEILNRAEVLGDKVLVFSQSLNTLNMIEEFLDQQMRIFRIKNPMLISKTYDQVVVYNDGVSHSWVPNVDYLRIDGKCSADQRMKLIQRFNDVTNTRSRLMLVSTRAGGVGINLVGANRCIIFDCSWNPANDLQAIYRVFRYGQNKPVYIYRFVGFGTMENKIYDRQVLKQSLSHRVVDEKQIGRYFKSSDLQELYEFNCNYEEARKVPLIPKDALLSDVMLEHKDLIIETLEHDSLLENRPDEDLTEDERKAAWCEYENEGKAVVPPLAAMDPSQMLAGQSLLQMQNPPGWPPQFNAGNQQLQQLQQQSSAFLHQQRQHLKQLQQQQQSNSDPMSLLRPRDLSFPLRQSNSSQFDFSSEQANSAMGRIAQNLLRQQGSSVPVGRIPPNHHGGVIAQAPQFSRQTAGQSFLPQTSNGPDLLKSEFQNYLSGFQKQQQQLQQQQQFNPQFVMYQRFKAIAQQYTLPRVLTLFEGKSKEEIDSIISNSRIFSNGIPLIQQKNTFFKCLSKRIDEMIMTFGNDRNNPNNLKLLKILHQIQSINRELNTLNSPDCIVIE